MIEHNITGMTLCLTVHHVEELDELSQLSFKANTDQATVCVSLHVLSENNNSQCYESPDICPEILVINQIDSQCIASVDMVWQKV